MNLDKRIKITERTDFLLRVDVIDILNHPIDAPISLDINNVNFERISVGNRKWVVRIEYPVEFLDSRTGRQTPAGSRSKELVHSQ